MKKGKTMFLKNETVLGSWRMNMHLLNTQWWHVCFRKKKLFTKAPRCKILLLIWGNTKKSSLLDENFMVEIVTIKFEN